MIIIGFEIATGNEALCVGAGQFSNYRGRAG